MLKVLNKQLILRLYLLETRHKRIALVHIPRITLQAEIAQIMFNIIALTQIQPPLQLLQIQPIVQIQQQALIVRLLHTQLIIVPHRLTQPVPIQPVIE